MDAANRPYSGRFAASIAGDLGSGPWIHGRTGVAARSHHGRVNLNVNGESAAASGVGEPVRFVGRAAVGFGAGGGGGQPASVMA